MKSRLVMLSELPPDGTGLLLVVPGKKPCLWVKQRVHQHWLLISRDSKCEQVKQARLHCNPHILLKSFVGARVLLQVEMIAVCLESTPLVDPSRGRFVFEIVKLAVAGEWSGSWHSNEGDSAHYRNMTAGNLAQKM